MPRARSGAVGAREQRATVHIRSGAQRVSGSRRGTWKRHRMAGESSLVSTSSPLRLLTPAMMPRTTVFSTVASRHLFPRGSRLSSTLSNRISSSRLLNAPDIRRFILWSVTNNVLSFATQDEQIECRRAPRRGDSTMKRSSLWTSCKVIRSGRLATPATS